MSEQRRYSDQEVGLILKRAAEMSQAKGAGGMTAAELERIAIEAGIDPAAVRLAAEEVARGETGGDTGELLLGGPTGLRYVFEVDGELREEDHEALLAAVQRNVDASGSITVAGRTFSWHATGPNRSITVQVSPVRGKTVVRIEERLGSLIGGIYGGVGGGVGGSLAPLAGVGAAALFGPVGAVLAVAGALLGTYVGTRAIYGGVSKRRKKTLDALAADLRATLEEILPPATETTTTTTTTRASRDSALDEARERQGLAPAPDARERAVDEAHEDVAASAERERDVRRG